MKQPLTVPINGLSDALHVLPVKLLEELIVCSNTHQISDEALFEIIDIFEAYWVTKKEK